MGRSFEWIDCTDKENTVLSFLRKDGRRLRAGGLEFYAGARDNYRVGVPHAGRYVEKLSSDDLRSRPGASTKRPPSSKPIRSPPTAVSNPSNCSCRTLGCLILAPMR